MIQLFSLFHLLRETVQLYALCTRNQGTVALDLAMNANFIRITTTSWNDNTNVSGGVCLLVWQSAASLSSSASQGVHPGWWRACRQTEQPDHEQLEFISSRLVSENRCSSRLYHTRDPFAIHRPAISSTLPQFVLSSASWCVPSPTRGLGWSSVIQGHFHSFIHFHFHSFIFHIKIDERPRTEQLRRSEDKDSQSWPDISQTAESSSCKLMS